MYDIFVSFMAECHKLSVYGILVVDNGIGQKGYTI